MKRFGVGEGVRAAGKQFENKKSLILLRDCRLDFCNFLYVFIFIFLDQ